MREHAINAYYDRRDSEDAQLRRGYYKDSTAPFLVIMAVIWAVMALLFGPGVAVALVVILITALIHPGLALVLFALFCCGSFAFGY